MEVKHPTADVISTFSSTRAVFMKNLRKSSSLRSPRNSRKVITLMQDWMLSMVPFSRQNLRLSLPVASTVFSDCELNKSTSEQFQLVMGHAAAPSLWTYRQYEMMKNSTTICSVSTLGKHLSKAGNILASLLTPKRTLNARTFKLGARVLELTPFLDWSPCNEQNNISTTIHLSIIYSCYWMNKLKEQRCYWIEQIERSGVGFYVFTLMTVLRISRV